MQAYEKAQRRAGLLKGVARFTEPSKRSLKCAAQWMKGESAEREWYMSVIFLTSLYSTQDTRNQRHHGAMCRDTEMQGKASRCVFYPLLLLIRSSCSLLCWSSVMCACVHWGLQLAHQTHSSRESTLPLQSPFSGSPTPGLLQRDRQLVRLGEVAFDVPGSAEASLFAHINAEEIQLKWRKRQADTAVRDHEAPCAMSSAVCPGCWPSQVGGGPQYYIRYHLPSDLQWAVTHQFRDVLYDYAINLSSPVFWLAGTVSICVCQFTVFYPAAFHNLFWPATLHLL